MGSQSERTRGKVAVGGPRQAKWWLADLVKQRLVELQVSHSRADKPGGITREPDRLLNSGLQLGEIKPQTTD